MFFWGGGMPASWSFHMTCHKGFTPLPLCSAPLKTYYRDFWSCRNMKKPLSQLKHVLTTCNGVSQKNLVYCEVDVFVKMIYYKVTTIEHEHFPCICLETPKVCVATLRTGLNFPRQSIWGITCLGLLSTCRFSYLSSWKPHKCVLPPWEQASLFLVIDLRGHMPRFTLKTESFPIYLLRNPINVCWNPESRAHFSETINLRGYMPMFTWKMNIFPSISLETP